MPNWISFNINQLRSRGRAGKWLKTTALAVFEHGVTPAVFAAGWVGQIGTHRRQRPPALLGHVNSDLLHV
jgi:hypothetical protein